MDVEYHHEYLVELIHEQIVTDAVEAETADQAIELVNALRGKLEQPYPPEILTERTRVIR